MAEKASKVTVHNKSTEGARVVSDAVGGEVLLQPGESKEVELSAAAVEHYKKKAEVGGDIQFGEPKVEKQNLEQMSKEELVVIAQRKGIAVSDGWTQAEIANAIAQQK
jgi:hypothetical protein